MNLILLIVMLSAAVLTVLTRTLLKSVLCMAVVSAALTVIMFRLNSPLAAVFELSVCTGLITAVFISTIALTKPLSYKELIEMTKGRIRRYWCLPVIIIVVGFLLSRVKIPVDFRILKMPSEDVRNILWNYRQLDLLGQIVVLLSGIFGIVVLFKDKSKDEH